jgi:metal-responsive CopG/Arc/MetJ family transcriptional regulator
MELRKTERIPIMFDPAMLKEVDEYRFTNRIGTRAAAIRELIMKGIEATETKKADALA